MIDIEEIERLAKAATPGPWQASDYGSYDGKYECWYVDTSAKQADIYRDDCDIAPNHRGGERGKRDMQFIAAAHPAAVLALIAEVRRLREINAQLSERGTLLYAAAHYADSVCGMLRQGGWPGKAEALEGRIKAVIDFDAARAKDSK